MIKTRYFKSNKSYLNFINKNRDKKIKYFICKTDKKLIRVSYEFA